MKIKNCVEDFVFEKIDSVLKEDSTLCRCEKCRTDIALLALNSLKPRYVCTDMGDTYTRLDLYEKVNNLDIMCAVARAVTIVKEKPRHDQ